MLLDLLEEPLNLPAAFVQCDDRQFKQGRVVGQEQLFFSGLRVFEADAPQLLGIVLKDVDTVEHDVLIADDDGTPINFHRVHSMCVYSSFGASYEERTRLMQREQMTEIQITPFHHIESHCHKGQGMQSDCRFVDVKRFPWEQQQTKIYCCCIECIDRIGWIDIEAVVAIQFACTPDQRHRQLFSDVPVARFVGIGQCQPVRDNPCCTALSGWPANRLRYPADSSGRSIMQKPWCGIARFNSDCACENCRYDAPRFSRSSSMTLSVVRTAFYRAHRSLLEITRT